MRKLMQASIGGTNVEVDLDETRAAYKGQRYNWCQCAGCTNFRCATHFFPKHTAALLEMIGVDPHEPIFLSNIGEAVKHYGVTRYTGWYFAYGRIIEVCSSARFYDPQRARSFVWLDPVGFIEEERENHHFEQGTPVLKLRFSLLMPWLPEYIPSLNENGEDVLLINSTRVVRLDWEKSRRVYAALEEVSPEA
jgi:hypothetical protein